MVQTKSNGRDYRKQLDRQRLQTNTEICNKSMNIISVDSLLIFIQSTQLWVLCFNFLVSASGLHVSIVAESFELIKINRNKAD